jgi:hypothetical protein
MGHTALSATKICQHPDNETLYLAAGSIKEKLDKVRGEG